MFGERLRLARKKSGYTLRGLSEALGGAPTAQAISMYERDVMTPSSDVLVQFTKVLDVTLQYLLSQQIDQLETIEYRKLHGTGVKDRAAVEAIVIDRLQRQLAIEEILDLDSATWKTPMSGDRFLGIEEEGEVLAQDIRLEWMLGIDPIKNVTSLLEERGIRVLMTSLPTGVSGLTCVVRRTRQENLLPVIVVNGQHTLERRRFTLAHELAHRLIDDTSPVNYEKASNVFAGAFLVPRDHLLRKIGRRRKAFGYQELIQMKRLYGVSAAMLLVRLKQADVINQSTLAYAFQTFASNWRKFEPEPLEIAGEEGKHEIPQRFERLCYWACAEKIIDEGKACELLQVSLAEIEQKLKGPFQRNANVDK